MDVDPNAELSRPVRDLLADLDGDATGVRPTALALDT